MKVPLVALMLPSATVEALRMVKAEPVALVVVMVPSLNCAAPAPALMLMVPLPELIVVAVFCVKPTLVNEMLPLVLVTLPVTVKAASSTKVKTPLVAIAAKLLMVFALLPKTTELAVLPVKVPALTSVDAF